MCDGDWYSAQGAFGNARTVCGGHNDWEVLLAFSGWGPECVLKYTGQPGTSSDYHVQSVISVLVENHLAQ